MSSTIRHLGAYLSGVLLALTPLAGVAQTVIPQVAEPDRPTYADLVDLADSAPLVLRVEVTRATRVDDARVSGVTAGHGRFFVEAKTQALLAGNTVLGESARYLVDLPLDARSKPPKLKKKQFLLFARPVNGRPGELQLVTPRAQISWNPVAEETMRGILKELVAPDAPAKVTGVRELLYVPGTLAGQGETQIFLNTANGSAASITVRHQPGEPLAWAASFSELLADLGAPPKRDTLAWYRLACFLPNNPPASANISENEADRRQAAADYRTVLGELGVCERTRK